MIMRLRFTSTIPKNNRRFGFNNLIITTEYVEPKPDKFVGGKIKLV